MNISGSQWFNVLTYWALESDDNDMKVKLYFTITLHLTDEIQLCAFGIRHEELLLPRLNVQASR